MPMAGPRAMGTRENFGLSGARTSKSLKKSRAARAKDGQNDLRNRRSAAHNRKGEVPAKMTYSRTDFLDRD